MKVLVIHAAKLVERGIHIDRMLKGIGMDYEFVKEADADVLTDELVDRYLSAEAGKRLRPSVASCAIKHFMACEKVVEEGWEGALILEDDILLHRDFMKGFTRSMKEYRRNYVGHSILISYEDSSLRFVPRSQRRKGRMLYPAKKGRMTGAFYLNRMACQALVDSIREKRCYLPIDHYHNLMIEQGKIECLWCQPALASQGSFTGDFHSSISSKKHFAASLNWWAKKKYKQLLYWLR